MFFRIKKVKGKEYAYIVENEWSKKGSRQKVKGYLGRVYRLSLSNEISFTQFKKIESIENYVKDNTFKKIINDLIEWELFRHGIDNSKFSIDLSELKILQNKRDVVLLVNDGFMCSMTLKSLAEFKPEGDEKRDGYSLARAFVEAGIKIPQDVFVGLFGKLSKTTHNE